MSLELSHAKSFVNWIARKVELNHLSSNAKARQVLRGEVYWCEFGLNVGSEMSKETPRPAVVIQNNSGNKFSSNTIVIPITHDSGSGPYLVPIQTQYKYDRSILLDGKANTSNVICVSKARLGGYITVLPQSDIRKIDESLSNMTGLKRYYDKQKRKYDDCHRDFLLLQSKIRTISEMVRDSNIEEETKKALQNFIDNG